MANIAGRNVKNGDLGVLGAGVLAFIFSLFPWFGVDLGPFGSVSRNAWGVGFLAWFPILLSIAVTAFAALRVFAPQTVPGQLPAGPNVLILLGSGVAAVLAIIKLLIGYHSIDRKAGLYLGVIALVVQAAFAFLNFRESGEKLPEFGGGTSTPPAV